MNKFLFLLVVLLSTSSFSKEVCAIKGGSPQNKTDECVYEFKTFCTEKGLTTTHCVSHISHIDIAEIRTIKHLLDQGYTLSANKGFPDSSILFTK